MLAPPARLVAVASLLIAVAGPVSAAQSGGDRTDLRRRDAALAERSDSIVVHLAGLERRLAAARAELAAVESRAAALRRQRSDVGRRLVVARANVRAAQRGLASRLRALYVSSGPAPLEVVLGARSLREAMVALDGLAFTAKQDRELVAETRSARTHLMRLRRVLARKASAIERARAAAAARTAALERARATKAAYLEHLRAERRLTEARIAELDGRARALAAPTPATPAAADVAATPTARTVTVVASGYALRGSTATGATAGWGVVAVDPAVIPLGTTMIVPGYGSAVAADVGPAISGAAIDLWFPSEQEALAWGRRVVTVTLGSPLH